MSKKILFLITLLCAVVQGARADFSETIDIGEPRGRRTISTEHFDLEAEVGWNLGDGPRTGACLRTDPDENAILKSRDWEIITSVEISFCNEYDAKCFISGNNKTYITRKGNVCTIPNVNSKELILSTDDWRVVYFYSITVYYTDAFTVSYDGNGNTGGTVPDNARKNYDQDLTLSSNVLTRQGFTHDGWATSPNTVSGVEASYKRGNHPSITPVVAGVKDEVLLIVDAEMTSMSTGGYLVSDDVTFNERITINGDVVLNLGEGATLTSKKGIEVSDGNRLTINGPGSMDIFGGDNNKSGIGAVEVGEIIINGGNIKVAGGALAAAIGGDHNNTKGGRITINGGVVKATALLGACIGGGSTDKKDGGIYGVCGDVVINGGQVDVGTTINIGIGPGLEYNEPYHNSGTLTLGWTNPDDYIKYGYFATRKRNILNSFTFADGKMFILEGTNTIATASNIANAKLVPAAVLFDKSDNSTLLSDWEGKPLPALLADRTLYKDGKWNTLCLPFSTKLADSPLEGAIARPLTAASITGTTLNLTFGDAVDVLVAGTPYIIKWTRADDYVDDDAHNIVNPLFKGVTIDAADHSYDNAASGDLRVRFLGTYKSTEFDGTDKSILLMGGNNTLYYPASDAGLGAQRAYFKIGSDGAARTRSITAFNMSFGGDDETTGIISQSDQGPVPLIRWYTIDGRRLSGKPSCAGVYINNGKKVVIK